MLNLSRAVVWGSPSSHRKESTRGTGSAPGKLARPSDLGSLIPFCVCLILCLALSSSLPLSLFHPHLKLDPRIVWGKPCLEVQHGQFLCVLYAADSQPPATLSWVLEDRVLSWSSPVGSRTLALELPWVKAGDSGHYTCRAENRLDSQQHTLDLSVLCEYDLPKAPGSEKGKGVTLGSNNQITAQLVLGTQ